MVYYWNTPASGGTTAKKSKTPRARVASDKKDKDKAAVKPRTKTK